MAKTGAIVARALRLLRVIDLADAPMPDQYTVGQTALNAMMAQWEHGPDGLALGWVPVDNPDDDFPAPEWAEDAITFNLAVKLRPEFGSTLDPDVVVGAQSGYSAILTYRTASSDNHLSLDDLPYPDGCRRGSLSAFYRGY